MIYPVFHIALHFLIPGLVALLFYKHRWQLAWLAMVLTLHFRAHGGGLAWLTRFDFGFRVVVVAGLLGAAAAMFLSAHDLQVVLVVAVTAGLLGVALAIGLGRAVLRGSQTLVARLSAPSGRALGAARLAQKYGAPERAAHSKGLEMPAYDPRGALGMALGYALSTRGGCHLRAYPISHEILRKPVATDRFTFSGKARIITLKPRVVSRLRAT